jgi:hypothetical protein
MDRFSDMGFSGLRLFGPQLVHHTQLKVRSGIAPRDFLLVDSPGMIDSPTAASSRSPGGALLSERGYDFEGVCRWLAERADVVLLFFDPDKPGTTGETLGVLTAALAGQEHKLHILLNKADQFRRIHDFARAYGSLCWNLAKVIRRKDLPRIYTMCLPASFHSLAAAGSPTAPHSSLGPGLGDLDAAREDVVAEVFNAPARRVDNEVSRLAEAGALLKLHLKVVGDLASEYRRSRLTAGLTLAAGWSLALGIPLGIVTTGFLPLAQVAWGAAAGSVGMAGMTLLQIHRLSALSERLCTSEAAEQAFVRLHARRGAGEDARAEWSRVAEGLKSLLPVELREMGGISTVDLRLLSRIVEEDVPALRRSIAPAYHKPTL